MPNPPRGAPAALRHVAWWAVPLLLLVVTLVLMAALHRAADGRAAQAGQERADQAAAVVQGELRRANGVVTGTRLLFEADPAVSRVNVERLGPTLTENSRVIALAFAPRVDGDSRAAFEAAEGVAISRLGTGGRLVPAPRRPVHFPASVVVPASRSAALRGLDALTVPPLAGAVDRAINTGRTQTVSLADLAAEGQAFAQVQPVYRDRSATTSSARQQATLGVVIGAYPVSGLRLALDGSLGAGSPYRLLLAGEPVIRAGAIEEVSATDFSAVGGRWRIEVVRPAADNVPVAVAGVGGIGIVLLVAALLLQLTRVEREREGADRSADEARAERDRTRSIVRSLQEGLVILDREGRVSEVNDRFCQLTGTGADEVRGLELSAFIESATPEQAALAREKIAAVDAADLDCRLSGPGGVGFQAMLSIAPFRDSEGAIAGTVCTIKDISERKRSEDELRASEGAYRQLAVEQGAFRRVATAVAEESEPEVIYGLVAEEAARMLDADAGWVARLDGPSVHVLGSWGDADPPAPVGGNRRIEPGWAIAELARTGHVTRRRRSSEEMTADPSGHRHSVIAPIRVSGTLWGGLAVGRNRDVFPPEADDRIVRVAELLATAVTNAENRALLAAQANRDPLTELANHRSFWEHLRRCADRARRYETPLSLILFDIDHFKQINDLHGHQAGDRTLSELSQRLRPLVREGELVARIGGEEFAWILPETDAVAAEAAAERARQVVSGTEVDPVGRVTVSAGVCDLARARDANELYALADGALYWAKSSGRDQAVRYDPDVVKALSAEERRQKSEQERVLFGLRGLARAVDARDPMTQEHSERVAALSEALALRVGWGVEDAARLREAALLHDVGKVGTPDAILLKAGALDPAEVAKVREHVELSTSIASEVLDAEQVSWIRAHHERFDGTGYPAGLAGPQIPEGARIMALADAWDVMVAARPYKEPSAPREALEECRRSAGTHFDPKVVCALLGHWAADPGDLAPAVNGGGASASR